MFTPCCDLQIPNAHRPRPSCYEAGLRTDPPGRTPSLRGHLFSLSPDFVPSPTIPLAQGEGAQGHGSRVRSPALVTALHIPHRVVGADLFVLQRTALLTSTRKTKRTSSVVISSELAKDTPLLGFAENQRCRLEVISSRYGPSAPLPFLPSPPTPNLHVASSHLPFPAPARSLIRTSTFLQAQNDTYRGNRCAAADHVVEAARRE